jgi:hypothetical protein
MRKITMILVSLFLFMGLEIHAQQKILLYMDLRQADHLKAYGVAYWSLEHGTEVDWLLNYRGGSFMTDYSDLIANECRVRGVGFEAIGGGDAAKIYAEVQSPDNNMDVVRLEKAPKVAVYVPPGYQPWDDAVTLALQYAEIPFDKLWDDEVLTGKLDNYDWLHLHHEDFTGQYGKFYRDFANAAWYIAQQNLLETEAKKHGFKKVSELEKAVVKTIKQYMANGGFLFAMCSATDTYDIALAAENTDICDVMYDGDPPDPDYQKKLDYSKCVAFQNFTVERNPYRYEYSDIDVPPSDMGLVWNPESDYFTLFQFSAKYDPVPSMLTQNHVSVVRGFMGQTTGFKKNLIRPGVLVMAEKDGTEQVKYLHGSYAKGTFTFYGGHDPEDYTHQVYDPPTDLALHKNSPGYRLILNNVLFPAAKKKQQKT